jgi:precorrin-2 dehydrogenase / sirohydrochlorin ferrochelatase
MGRFFPLALMLEGRSCLVIGSGAEAVRRASALLEAGAVLDIVAAAPSHELRTFTEANGLPLHERAATGSDLDGRWLAVFTDRDAELAAVLGAEAEARRVFFCAVDEPRASTFAHMAQARAGLVTVSVSTQGKAPALGRKLCSELGRLFDEAELAKFADALARLREVTPSHERGAVLGEAVAGVSLEGRLRL